MQDRTDTWDKNVRIQMMHAKLQECPRESAGLEKGVQIHSSGQMWPKSECLFGIQFGKIDMCLDRYLIGVTVNTMAVLPLSLSNKLIKLARLHAPFKN